MNSLIMNLPLALLIVFFINYSIRSLFIIYHLLKFGLDHKTKALAIIFSAGSAFLIYVNFYLFLKIEWDRYIDISIFRNFL